MSGVEILTSNEVVVELLFNWKAFVIAFVTILAFSIFVGFILSIVKDVDWIALKIEIIVGVLLGSFFGTVFGFELGIPVAYETQYKVTVSDEVQMNSFLEKYEILNQEGKIYTVKKKR